MKSIRIINIPDGTMVAVFAVAEGKTEVHGDAEATYFAGKPDVSEISVALEPPPTGPVLIRARHVNLRWRPDMERKDPNSGKWHPELLLEDPTHEQVVDLAEYLEPDPVMQEDPASPPLVSFSDLSDYPERPSRKDVWTVRTLPAESPEVARRHILATFPRGHESDFHDFRHRLGRAFIWLLYPLLPQGHAWVRTVFFYYEFGPHQEGLSSELLEREPWRTDPENSRILQEKREDFTAFARARGAKVEFLTTRELNAVDARFLQQEDPFTLSSLLDFQDPRSVWRYMTFAKFVSLLERKAVWFARPSTFLDPFESKTNHATRANLVAKTVHHVVRDFNLATRDGEAQVVERLRPLLSSFPTNEDGTIAPLTFGSLADLPLPLRAYAEDVLDEHLDRILVSSWNLGSSESDAFWGLYADRRTGVAVRSSFKKLTSSFRSDRHVPAAHAVIYADLHNSEEVFPYLPPMYKHTAFQHEQELRLYVMANEISDAEKGLYVELDLSAMIEEVVLAPEALSWFESAVGWALAAAGLDSVPLRRSVFKSRLA